MQTHITVTAKRKHFDAAVRAFHKGLYVTHTCLIAQVFIEKFNNKNVSVGQASATVTRGKKANKFLIDNTGQNLIVTFDNLVNLTEDPNKREQKKIDKFRDSLPLKFTITPEI